MAYRSVGVVGYGRWGKNIVRTLQELKVPAIHVVSDVPIDGVSVVASPEALLHCAEAVIIATPAATHAKLAETFLRAKMPVFLEKPMATSVKDAKRILTLSKKNKTPVFVGHIHLFNPVLAALKKALPKIGTVKVVEFDSGNWGPFRTDTNVLWDWLPHDVSILLVLFGKPEKVSGSAHTVLPSGKQADFAKARFDYKGFTVYSTVSWVSTVKKRRATFQGEKGCLVWDETFPEKLSFRADGKTENLAFGKVPALSAELSAFIRKQDSLSDAEFGSEVVQTIARIEKTMA